MKKMKWIGKLAGIIAAGALISFTMSGLLGCTQTLDDEDERSTTGGSTPGASSGSTGGSGTGGETGSGLYIGLGGENTFNLTAVEIDGTAQTIKHTTLKPSAWNAISEFETVQLKKGSSVSYSFTQAEVGSEAWNTWALAVYDNATVANAKGTFLRGDNWLNKSTDAGFKSGLWSEGGVTAGGTYSNDYTYETAGKSLKSTDNVVIKVEYSDTGLKITETINGTLAYTTEGKLSSSGSADSGSGDSGTGEGTGGAGAGGEETGVMVENLTAVKTLSATENTGYTVKLGCDASAMKVTSVKYNDSELMPANTAYTLENLSFNGVNVSGLSADTWSVEYTYTMTKVGTQNWEDYNFEISDGNTENKALGYWSLRYDNYAVGYLNGYHEYGTWTSEHVDGVSAGDAAYGGHWYGMTGTLKYDHSESLNKTLVMKIEKTDSAFVITITSDGTQIWKCTNDKAVSSGNSGETGTGEGTGESGTGESSGESGTGGESETNIPVAAYTAKLDGTDTGVAIVGNGSYVDDEKFGKVFKNDGTAQRTSYLQLPADTLQHSATSKEMTIGFWVNANGVTTDWLPMFAAYHAASNNNANTFPMFMCQSRCKLQVNCAGWCDFTLEQKTDGIAEYSSDVNVGYSGWKDSNWHYYTCSITETKARIYIDGVLIVEWTIDGTSDGQVVSGLFANAGDTALSYVCLGGNQAWDWADNDAPYSFAKFSIWNTALSQEQIQAVVAAN